jgi:hypothetical protein
MKEKYIYTLRHGPTIAHLHSKLEVCKGTAKCLPLPSDVVLALGKKAPFADCLPAHSTKGLRKGSTRAFFVERQD